jgi:hypothetical protein
MAPQPRLHNICASLTPTIACTPPHTPHKRPTCAGKLQSIASSSARLQQPPHAARPDASASLHHSPSTAASHSMVRRALSHHRATKAFFNATIDLLSAHRTPTTTAVVSSSSAALLRIPQAAFSSALSLVVNKDGSSGGCLGQRVQKPLTALCRILSAPPESRGLCSAVRAVAMLSFHNWLMRFPRPLQLSLIAHAELKVFHVDELIFRQVCASFYVSSRSSNLG